MTKECYDRLIQETDELRGRYEKLQAFIKSMAFEALPAKSQGLLIAQENAMHGYLAILCHRLEEARVEA